MKPDMERISNSAVRRLSTYLQVLDDLSEEEIELVSSRELALRSGVTSAQVRKDLSCLGSLGRRGLGYMVEHLRREIRAILGLSRSWRLGLVGAGNIGSALVTYRGFARQGFEILAVFDNAPDRIGDRIAHLTVEPIARFEEVCLHERLEIGVIATPAQEAQEVAELMVHAGLRGVLNFAPRKIEVPEHVVVRTVNMALELESLSFNLSQVDARGGGPSLD